jgi:DNA-binding IclR family transcriptional regulator
MRKSVPPGRGNEEPYLLKSVDNALRLVRLMADGSPRRLGEVAAYLGVAPSTAHRLLGSLRHRGFVVQDRRDAYRAGPALGEIAMAATARPDIRRVARPALERLRDSVQETVSLLVLEGTNVLFIDSIEGPQSVRVGSRLGMVFPARHTSAGKALLAALPEPDVARLYPAASPLLPELERVRRAGFATNFEEREVGVSAIGACVRDPAGSPLAAVAVAAPASRLPGMAQAAALVEPLLAAVAFIERLFRDEQARLSHGNSAGEQAPP